MRLYTVYDRVAEMHGPVFEQPNDASAVRNLERMLASDKSKNPSDYCVRCVGEFFPESGRITRYYDPDTEVFEDLIPRGSSIRFLQDEMEEALAEGDSANG